MTACDDVRIKYQGDGVTQTFPFPFPYQDKDDIMVALWDESLKQYVEKPNSFAVLNGNIVEFIVAPPLPPSNNLDFYNVIIFRKTVLDAAVTTFYPGSSIRAQDLNDDFDQLRYALEEDRCAIASSQETLDETYIRRDQIVEREDQEKGFWSGNGDQDFLASTGAIAARHDVYVDDNLPFKPQVEQQGKGWQNTDECRTAYWNSEAEVWVSYVNTGPRGEQGPQGPTGPQGEQGSGIDISGDVPTFDDLPDPAPEDSFWYVIDVNEIWYWSGDQWLSAGSPGGTGPRGPVGPQGPVGPKGLQGDIGPEGPDGPEGPQGIEGPAGGFGPEGPQGVPGVGINLKGEVATEGDLPTTGNVVSDAWHIADTDEIAIWIEVIVGVNEWYLMAQVAGPEGPVGPQGSQGIQGVQGLQGFEGPVGPKGDPFVYADFTEQQLEGLEGPEGPPGPEGPQGPAGDGGVDVILPLFEENINLFSLRIDLLESLP